MLLCEKINLQRPKGQVSVRIIGVSKSTLEKMVGSFIEDEKMGYIALPITTAASLDPEVTKITSLNVMALTKDDIDATSKQIVNQLATRHNVPGKKYFIRLLTFTSL